MYRGKLHVDFRNQTSHQADKKALIKRDSKLKGGEIVEGWSSQTRRIGMLENQEEMIQPGFRHRLFRAFSETKCNSVSTAFSFGIRSFPTQSDGRTPFLLILFGCGFAARQAFFSEDERRRLT